MKSNYKPLNLGIVLFLGCAFFAHASNVYISDSGNGTILQLGSGGSESVFASGLNSPAGLAFDGNGNLFVADSGDGTILRFTPSGGESVFASGLNDPSGLAFGKDGDLYVANQGDGTVLQFAPSGSGSIFISSLGYNPDPTYLAFDSNGNLFATTELGINEFSSSGTPITSYSDISQIYGIAYDNTGDFYVAKQNPGKIERWFGSGGPTTPLQYPYDINPYQLDPMALAFDGSGNLYATFSQLGYYGAGGQDEVLNGVVMEFTSNGIGTILASGLTSPGYLAVQNSLTVPPIQFVPEPPIWAMLITGMAVLLAGWRFRKTRLTAVPVRIHRPSGPVRTR